MAGALARLPGTCPTEAQVFARQLIGRVHGNCSLKHFAGLFQAACREERPAEIVDKLLILRFKLQRPLGRRYRFVMVALVTRAARKPIIQGGRAGEYFDGRPIQLQRIFRAV